MTNKDILIVNNKEIGPDSLRSNRFTENAIKAFRHSVDRAVERGICGVLDPLILLWAILRWEEKMGVFVLKACGVDRWSLEYEVEHLLIEMKKCHHVDDCMDCTSLVQLSVEAKQEASLLGLDYVGTEHVLLALLRTGNEVLQKVFEKNGISYSRFREELEAVSLRAKTPEKENAENGDTLPQG